MSASLDAGLIGVTLEFFCIIFLLRTHGLLFPFFTHRFNAYIHTRISIWVYITEAQQPRSMGD